MSTVVSGVGDWALSVMVREPVTVMTPMSSAAASGVADRLGGVPGAWAQAELAARAADAQPRTRGKIPVNSCRSPSIYDGATEGAPDRDSVNAISIFH